MVIALDPIVALMEEQEVNMQRWKEGIQFRCKK
jgi:hypothetical protein